MVVVGWLGKLRVSKLAGMGLAAGAAGLALVAAVVLAEGEPIADLKLSFVNAPVSLAHSQFHTATLRLENRGPAASESPRVLAFFPAQLQVRSTRGPAGSSCATADVGQFSTIVSCTLPTLVVSGTTDIEIGLRALAPNGKRVVAQAHATSIITDTQHSDNSPDWAVRVGMADLALTGLMPQFVAARPISVELRVRNLEGSDARGVRVITRLPDGLSYVRFVGGPATFDCSVENRFVICMREANMEVGDDVTFALILRHTLDDDAGGIYRVVSVVVSDTEDDSIANNTVALETSYKTVKLSTVLQLQSGMSRASAHPFVVRNDGPGLATNARFLMNLAPGVTLQSATPSQGACTLAAFSCSLGDIPANTEVTINVDLNAPAGFGASSFSAESDELNETPEANTLSLLILNTVELAARVSSEPAIALPGTASRFRFVVTNTMGGAASNVQAYGVLPSNAGIGAIAPSQGSCTRIGPEVSCALGTLASGATAQVVVNITATRSISAEMAATMQFSAAEPDSDYSNNTASTTLLVNAWQVFLPATLR